MSKYIVHLTPSLANNNNVASENLGDLIIFKSVQQVLSDLFSGFEIVNISTHEFPENKHIRLIQQSALTFIGGSNLLSSNIRQYNQWKFYKTSFRQVFPEINNIQLLGVGWWQYQIKPTWFTSHFYKAVFSKKHLLSVRDNFTKKQLQLSGINNVINTSCPTTWALNGYDANKNKNAKKCIFSLTDYNPDFKADDELLGILLKYYEKLYFFPQGKHDVVLLEHLPVYKKNKNSIIIIDRNIEHLRMILQENPNNVNYVGTRLHLGIFCLQHQIPSMIISIDNRATEISKDINLPVIHRNNWGDLIDWLENKSSGYIINLQMNAINKWKQQYKEFN